MKTFAIAALSSALAIGASAAPATYPSGRINPITLSQYTVWTGAIDYDVQTGKVFKDGRSSDITTLVTFDIAKALSGKTCQLHFDLPRDAHVSGSGKFDVFTSQAPATQDTESWPPGNLRDEYVGRFLAVKGGDAEPGADGITTITTFPCPGGQYLAGEIVGVGDVDYITWSKASNGPYLTYY